MGRRPRLLFLLAAVVLGLASEAVAYGWDEPHLWVPDLFVGWVLIGSGLVVWSRWERRGAGALMACVGTAWFAGGFSSYLLYLHRGPLVHLLVAYPGARPRSRLDRTAVVLGYATAVAWPLWRSDQVSLVLCLLLVAVAGRGYRHAVGRLRRARLASLLATAGVAAALAGGAAARLAFPAGDAAEPALLVYEATLCLAAVYLVRELRVGTGASVADLVVELGETRSSSLRHALARALGDPGLEVGYWRAGRRAYFDHEGAVVAMPLPDTGRAATFLADQGRPVAVLVHDSAVLADEMLITALSTATGLAASNAALQAEVEGQLDELSASTRRLLAVAGEERRRLESRLRAGPERRLGLLADALELALPQARGETRDQLARAHAHLIGALAELRELAHGLHPRLLSDDGLAGAIRALGDHSRAPVVLTLRPTPRASREVEATVYFVCAEALANVAKYAPASRVTVALGDADGRLTVEVADDGVGGADATRGSGLRGLADRVEALGGTLSVDSPAGGGTRVRAEIPSRSS
jgi:signal transduction histidine kinase